MTDFETCPVGTAERIKALDSAPVAILDTRKGMGVFALNREDYPALLALHGKRVRLVVEEG